MKLQELETGNKVVSEGEVLVGTIKFLFRIGSTPTHISVARGQGIDTQSIKEEVKRVFRDEPRKSVKPEFVGSGPDIEAVSDDTITQRSNPLAHTTTTRGKRRMSAVACRIVIALQ